MAAVRIPKRPRCAYVLFCKEHWQQVGDDLYTTDSKTIIPELARRWNTIGVEELARFNEMARLEKAEHERRKQQWVIKSISELIQFFGKKNLLFSQTRGSAQTGCLAVFRHVGVRPDVLGMGRCDWSLAALPLSLKWHLLMEWLLVIFHQLNIKKVFSKWIKALEGSTQFYWSLPCNYIFCINNKKDGNPNQK